MAKIYISGEIPQIGYKLLSEHDVEVYRGTELITEQELGEKI